MYITCTYSCENAREHLGNYVNTVEIFCIAGGQEKNLMNSF